MPLPAEQAYWDHVAENSVALDGARYEFRDNCWKRPYQVKRLMAYDWIDKQILEIGVGNGVIGGIIRIISAHTKTYVGTELSEKFRKWSAEVFHLNTVNADVRELPACKSGGFERIIAFDSLEHVRPEHRDAGYKRIFEVAAPGAIMFIHYSYGKSYHDKEFDHPFGLEDILAIEKSGWTLLNYERHDCAHPNGPIPYAFAEFRK